jgi:hypothetical protein
MITSFLLSQTLVRESFEYPVGTFLNGSGGNENGWGGSWFVFEGEDSTFVVSDTDFNYNDNIAYPIENTGNHVIGTSPVVGAWSRLARPLATTWPNEAGKEYWLSFAAGYSNWSNDNGWAFVSFYYIGEDTTEGPGVGMSWQPNIALGTFVDWSTYPPVPLVHEGISNYLYTDSPYWLVVKIVMSGDTLSRAYLFVNPDPVGAEPDTSLSDAKADWNLVDGLQYMVIHFGGDVGGQQFKVDEIRLGDTWQKIATDVQNDINTPLTFKLLQNFPNPFNPETSITYSLKSSGKVHLSIWDLLGVQVKILVDEVQSAGKHQYNFLASDLSSGTYFYRLESNEGTIVKKMIFLK